MRLLVHAVSVAAFGMALAACSTTPQRVSANPPSFTYRYTGDELSQVASQASRDCASYNLRPQLKTVVRQSADNLAIYECI